MSVRSTPPCFGVFCPSFSPKKFETVSVSPPVQPQRRLSAAASWRALGAPVRFARARAMRLAACATRARKPSYRRARSAAREDCCRRRGRQSELCNARLTILALLGTASEVLGSGPVMVNSPDVPRARAQHDDNPGPSVLLARVGLIRSAEMARVSHAALQDTILDVARLDVAVFTDPDTSVCTRNAKAHGGCDCNRPFNITSTMMELWGDRLLAVRLVGIGDLMGRARDKQHVYARIRVDRGGVTMGASFMWRLLDAWQSQLQRLSRGYDHLLMMRPDVELMKPLSPGRVCAARPGVYHLIGGNVQNSGLNFFWNRDNDWASLACAPAGLGHWLSYWQEAREPADVARELGLPCPPPLPRDAQNRTLFIGRAWTQRACAPSCPLCHDVTLAFLHLMNASMGPANLDDMQIFVRLLRKRYACDAGNLLVQADSNHDMPFACMPDRCIMTSIRNGRFHQACDNCTVLCDTVVITQ